jgi:hypothetical protein
MFTCECGREFTKPQGLGYHRKFCGKKKISLDAGYEYYIGPDGRAVYIHREVMEQKLDRPLLSHEQVHHIDRNKRNNDPDNLELTDMRTHAKTHIYDGDHAFTRGSQNFKSKLNENDIPVIRNLIQQGITLTSIGKQFGVHRTVIGDIKHSRTWTHV